MGRVRGDDRSTPEAVCPCTLLNRRRVWVLLFRRQPLVDNMPAKEGNVWVDLGGGTGANLEFFGPGIKKFKKVVVVDLTPSLAGVSVTLFQRHCAPW